MTAIQKEIAWHKKQIVLDMANCNYDLIKAIHQATITRLEQLEKELIAEKVAMLDEVIECFEGIKEIITKNTKQNYASYLFSNFDSYLKDKKTELNPE